MALRTKSWLAGLTVALLTLACDIIEPEKDKDAAASTAAANPPPNPCLVALASAGSRPLNHAGHGDNQVDEPPEYHYLVNPCPNTPEVIARGKDVYDAECAKCHGPDGDPSRATNGPLDPPAKRLTVGGYLDPYVFWRVNVGGDFAPFNSAMPAFKDKLVAEDLWMVTKYVISLAGTDLIPLSPTIESVAPAGAALGVHWRLVSDCVTLRIDRKKDADAYGFFIRISGLVTEYDDTDATAPGRYCYQVSCEARGGRASPPSNEQCGTL
jgi:hypothetical protein